MSSSSLKKYTVISFFLIAFGLLVSAYLLYQYIGLQSEDGNTSDVCSTVFGKGCDNALQSEYSRIIGLPLAGWSLIFYAVLLLLIFVPALFGVEFKGAANTIVYIGTLIAFAAALILLGLMTFNTSLFCPLCTILHAINIALFFILNRARAFNFRDMTGSIGVAFRTIFSRQVFQPKIRWKIFGFASILFLMLSMYFGMFILTKKKSGEGFIDSAPILKEFYSQPVRNIPVNEDDPRLGPDSSGINIVVFSDFLCPSCKRFAKDLHRIIREGKGDYSIVFKHYPLSKECNPYIGKNLHPKACEMAYAAVAAQAQGKFWTFHDTTYNLPDGKYDDFVNLMARRSGLDMQQFESIRNTETVKAKVSKDVALAESLGIDATPTIFLNGRLVTDMRRGIPAFLVHKEIKRLSQEDSLRRLR